MTLSHLSQTNTGATTSSKSTVILIVEDEGIVGLDIQRRLVNLGYHAPHIAASGSQAIQRALSLRPDLALMDIRLKGGMDGISTAQQIQALLDIPVIFISAYADEDTLRRAKVTEPYAYILKPFEEREIHIAIEMALYKHQMSRKLKESERWLTTTINNIDDGVITTDSEGRVNLINPVATALTGWNDSEALGQPLATIWQIQDEYSRQSDPLLVHQILAGAKTATVEPVGLLISRTGEEIPIQYQAKAIRGQAEQVLGLVINFRDLRGARKHEAEQQRIQQLEAQQWLLTGVAHEWTNLAASLLTDLTDLQGELPTDSPLHQRLAKVAKGLMRNVTLSGQVAQLPGQEALSTPVVHDLMNRVQQLVKLLFGGSPIQTDFQAAPMLWPVTVDIPLISHALYQLLVNAKEAMADGGRLQVIGENYTLPESAASPLLPGPYLKLLLQDSGPGIAPADLPRVFAEDFTTKPRHSGRGLPIAQQIVQRLAGQIEIQSTPNAGTCVTLYLPATPQAEHAANSSSIKHAERQGRILVMDDEALIREATSALLEYLGYDYEMAKDGEEAVARYQAALRANQPFDVVILDLTVHHGLGGQQTLEQLRALDPSVKAIVSSGYFHDPVVANYQNYGFLGVVSKPYAIDAMSETLHRLIQLDDTPKTT